MRAGAIQSGNWGRCWLSEGRVPASCLQLTTGPPLALARLPALLSTS